MPRSAHVVARSDVAVDRVCACARARSRLVVVSMLSDVVQCVCLDCDRVGGRSSVAGAVRADCDAFVANFVLPRRDALMSDDDPVPSVRVDTCGPMCVLLKQRVWSAVWGCAGTGGPALSSWGKVT